MTVDIEIKRFILLRFIALGVFLLYYALPTDFKPSLSFAKKSPDQELFDILTSGASTGEHHNEPSYPESTNLHFAVDDSPKGVKHASHHKHNKERVRGVPVNEPTEGLTSTLEVTPPAESDPFPSSVEDIEYESKTMYISRVITETGEAVKSWFPESKYLMLMFLGSSVLASSIHRFIQAAEELNTYNTGVKPKSSSSSQKRRPRSKASARKALVEKIKSRTTDIPVAKNDSEEKKHNGSFNGLVDSFNDESVVSSGVVSSGVVSSGDKKSVVSSGDNKSVVSSGKNSWAGRNSSGGKKKNHKGRKARENGNELSLKNTNKRRNRKRVTEGKKGDRPRAFSQSSGSTSVSVNDENCSRSFGFQHDDVVEAKNGTVKEE